MPFNYLKRLLNMNAQSGPVCCCVVRGWRRVCGCGGGGDGGGTYSYHIYQSYQSFVRLAHAIAPSCITSVGTIHPVLKARACNP